MNWIDQLIELHISEIPYTKYGYWILPDGNVLVVGPMEHDEVGYKYLNPDPNDPDAHHIPMQDVYQTMFNAGAIRVVSTDVELEFVAHFNSKRTTRLALSTLRSLIQDSDHEGYIIEDIGRQDDIRVLSKREALEIIQKLMPQVKSAPVKV